MDELRVGGTLDALGQIGAFVLEAARKARLDHRTAYRLRLAVDEMATNVVVHGQPRQQHADLGIRLLADLDDHHLTLTMEDRGPEFNPLAQQPPDDQLDKPMAERPIGGLGIFLALRGVDQFKYERVDGTNRTIFIVKRGIAPETAG